MPDLLRLLGPPPSSYRKQGQVRVNNFFTLHPYKCTVFFLLSVIFKVQKPLFLVEFLWLRELILFFPRSSLPMISQSLSSGEEEENSSLKKYYHFCHDLNRKIA